MIAISGLQADKNEKKVLINGKDPDLSNDSFTTVVTLRENGIADCKITANNYEGKMYLNTLNLGDTVQVDYRYENEEWYTVFSGNIWELNPLLSRSGEILQVVAYGKGYSLKIMRAAEEYGIQGHINMFRGESIIPQSYPVEDYDFDRMEWRHTGVSNATLPVNAWVEPKINDWEHVGTEPWLDNDDEGNYLDQSARESAVGATDRSYTFSGVANASHVTKVVLYVKGKLYDGVGGHAGYIRVRFSLWKQSISEWSNVGYYYYVSTAWQTAILDVTWLLKTISDLNQTKLEVMIDSIWDGGETKGGIRLTYSKLEATVVANEHYPWLHDYPDEEHLTWIGANPSNHGKVDGNYTFEQIPFGEATIINSLSLELIAKTTNPVHGITKVECQIFFRSEWFSLGEQNIADDEWQVITYPIYPEPYSTLTPEEINKLKLRIIYKEELGSILWEDVITQARLRIIGYNGLKCTLKNILTDNSDGIIPKFVNKVFGGVSSQHTIDTQYIYDYPEEYTYVYFPYESAYDCLQELIKLGCAMDAIKDRENKYKVWKGLHWIVNPSGQLLIAPIGNHHCNGTRPDIENVWASKIVSPIVVKEDILLENTKIESHAANYVLASGRFVLPMNDYWCENGGFSGWLKIWYSWLADLGTLSRDFNNAISGDMSLRFTGAHNRWLIYRELHNLDVTKLITPKSKVVIHLQVRGSGATNDKIKLRLYNNFQGAPPVEKWDFGDYFETEVEVPPFDPDDPEWTSVEVDIDYNDIIDIRRNNVWTKGYYWYLGEQIVGNPQWDNINYIGVEIEGASVTYNIDDFCILGNTIRAAYDSSKIAAVGCRMLTVKNSLAQTDNLDNTNDSGPLAQSVLYELLRNRVDVTTTTVHIPLSPKILAGQIVELWTSQLENGHYNIKREFRIIEVEHTFAPQGARTSLKLSSDLQNSLPVNSTDPYQTIMRAISPDFQNKTYASIRTGEDFDSGLVVIATDYPTT